MHILRSLTLSLLAVDSVTAAPAIRSSNHGVQGYAEHIIDSGDKGNGGHHYKRDNNNGNNSNNPPQTATGGKNNKNNGNNSNNPPHTT